MYGLVQTTYNILHGKLEDHGNVLQQLGDVKRLQRLNRSERTLQDNAQALLEHLRSQFRLLRLLNREEKSEKCG